MSSPVRWLSGSGRRWAADAWRRSAPPREPGTVFPTRIACRALGVSQSWFSTWRDRPPTPWQDRRTRLAEHVREISPRIGRHLRLAAHRCGAAGARVAGLGRHGRHAHGRAGPGRPARLSSTRQGKRSGIPDLVRREFTTTAPNVVRCGDLTEITTGEGQLCRPLRWTCSPGACSATPWASVTTPTWRWPRMAAATRGGDIRGVVLHSDRAVSTSRPRSMTRAPGRA